MTYQCTCHNKVRLTLDEAFDLAEVKADIEWVPVLKAVVEPVPPQPVPNFTFVLPDSISIPPMPTPIVNVAPPTVNVEAPIIPAPVVNVPAPIVNIEAPPAPIVNVAAAKATTPQEVIVTSMPDRIHKAIRNPDGTIQGSIEGDYE